MLLYNSIRGVGSLSQGFQAKKSGIRQVGFVPPPALPLYRGRDVAFMGTDLEAKNRDKWDESLVSPEIGPKKWQQCLACNVERTWLMLPTTMRMEADFDPSLRLFCPLFCAHDFWNHSKHWNLCLECFTAVLLALCTGERRDRASRAWKVVGQIKECVLLPEVRNWHGKGSCCRKLTRCCQKASWQCFERRRWLPLAATSLHHDWSMLLSLDVHVVQKVMWAGIHNDWCHFGSDVCSLFESKNYRGAWLISKRLMPKSICPNSSQKRWHALAQPATSYIMYWKWPIFQRGWSTTKQFWYGPAVFPLVTLVVSELAKQLQFCQENDDAPETQEEAICGQQELLQLGGESRYTLGYIPYT